jgi:glycosyltransferase involved in cell wall biosynthesis
MPISVVIPTCNRKSRLLALLGYLDRSTFPIQEVIVVDSGEERLSASELSGFERMSIQYLSSQKSVCIQRNIGIRQASGDWIFLCDDDIEMPADYLQQLMVHVERHPDAGAVSGLVLQKEKAGWQAKYPIRSSRELLWTFIFQLSIWGEIECGSNNLLIRKIKGYYQRKGNHLSKAGWPVITAFSGDYFTVPVFGLGASLIRKEWLMQSPYDEVLDRHGIGDNYGVAVSFPPTGVHIVNNAFVYHHQEPVNRLNRPILYFRRVMALDYFIRTKQELKTIKTRWLLWSLTGSLLAFLRRDLIMARAAFKACWLVASANNPYYKAAAAKKKITEPLL